MSKWHRTYKVHPAADVFPMMDDDELATLGADIRANGLTAPIVFWAAGSGHVRDADLILIDGRNRLEAMERAGIDLQYWDKSTRCSADPVADIISLNIRRRHLTKLQIAEMLVADALKGRLANAGAVPQRHVKGKAGSAKDAVKAAVVAKAQERGIGKRTVERAFEQAHEKPTLHPNAPKPLRAKFKRQAQKSRMAPTTLAGWRDGYLNLCLSKLHCPDIDAELQTIVDAFHEVAGKRLAATGTSKVPGDG